MFFENQKFIFALESSFISFKNLNKKNLKKITILMVECSDNLDVDCYKTSWTVQIIAFNRFFFCEHPT